MTSIPSPVDRLGLFSGVLCAVCGVALQGPESGILWLLVGYFVGKAIQSTLWTVTGDYPS